MIYFPKMWISMLVLFCTVACGRSEHSSDITGDIRTYHVDPDQAVAASLDDLIADVEFIALELPDSLHLSEARKVVFRDSLLYILDVTPTGSESRIFVFDLNGDFQFNIDRPGAGPGEYDYIYDLVLAGDMIGLATPAHLLFFDRLNGRYLRSVDNRIDNYRMQTIYFLDEETGVTAAGRTRANRSMHHLKFFDLNTNSFFHEAIPFPSHALKINHSYRFIFETEEGLRSRPENSNVVYRIEADGDSITVEPDYQFDFGDLWIPESFLSTSFQNMNRIFGERLADEFVHTVDIFENREILYATYTYEGDRYLYLYDKRTGDERNLSEITDNRIGWPLMPLATIGDRVAAIVYPFELEPDRTEMDSGLREIVDNSNDEGLPVLVLARFRLQ